MKAQDEPPVRRIFGELGRVGPVRAEDRKHVGNPGGGVLAEFQDAANGDARRAVGGSATHGASSARHQTEHEPV
jgi:hypothetical protein